jgi:parallel beta-helix repeat protein
MRNDVVTPNFSDLTKQNVFHLTSCSNVSISGNHFVRGLNQFVRFDGTALAENVNVYITENLFENGGKGAVEVRRYGRNVHVESNNFTNVCNQTISGITFDKSISVSGTIGVWIKDNYVLQNISGGGSIIVEFIDRQSEAVNIINNRVRGSTENGIKVGASVDVRVEGNSCMYPSANGIYIEGCYDAIVQNNYCYESGANAIRIFEDGDTGRLNRNVTVRGNTFQNSNMSGNTLGVVGASVGSTASYHLACRQSSYVYVYENMFVDDTTGQAGGIYMAATDYYIERNDMLRLKAGSVTFTNTSSIVSDRFRSVNNKGAQTTAQGLATILNGASSIIVSPDVVNESTAKVVQATPRNVLSGTVAYWCCLDEANNTFSIRTRDSAHAAATVTADTNFNWSFSVDNAIGIFGQTTR